MKPIKEISAKKSLQHYEKFIEIEVVKMYVTLKLSHQFWRIFNNVADFFWSRCLQQVLIQVSRQYEKNSSVRKILIIGISRPSKFHGFWAVMDQKMAQSWCKTIICQTISSFNWLLSLKYWFLSLKKGKVDMVKMCVTPKLRHQFWRNFNYVADFFGLNVFNG